MKKIIRVIVSPRGETKVETKGFSGGECREASRFIEQALGQRVDELLTPEFYQEQAADQRIKQSQ
jgi:Protein of unknown function (DUF2997)